MSPLPPIQQNGDAGRLEQLSSGLKRQNGTSGPVLQRNPVGRPATGQAQPQQQAEIAPEHQELGVQLAEADWSRRQWTQLAQTSPTPYVLSMKDVADREYDRVASEFYQMTPNFEP